VTPVLLRPTELDVVILVELVDGGRVLAVVSMLLAGARTWRLCSNQHCNLKLEKEETMRFWKSNAQQQRPRKHDIVRFFHFAALSALLEW
jgi:hypothetical protein